MSLRSAHCEIRALTARRASHQLRSYAALIVERYSSLSACVARSTTSLVGAILNALHYKNEHPGRTALLGIQPPACYFFAIVTAYLAYRAGPQVLSLIRDEGLDPRRVRVFAAPAGGPKWLVSVGFDRAIIRSRFLAEGSGRVLLAGSSAGAWRCLSMACSNPLEAHERLRMVYSRNAFTRQDTPRTISEALQRNVAGFLGDSDIPYILQHPVFDLAVHVVRSKGPAASENRLMQASALIAAAALNALTPLAMRLFAQRVVFFSGASAPPFVLHSFRGAFFRLTSQNIRMVALATGSLPCIIAGVRDVPGAVPGVYRDGGLVDYQLNQDYHPPEGTMTLFFHYRERIIPAWLDKALYWRKPSMETVARILQVYPTQAFMDLLPGKRLPDRTDFTDFMDRPKERIRRWDDVSELSEILGSEFLESVQSGKIRQLVQPLRQRAS
jgi:hypothetical protein